MTYVQKFNGSIALLLLSLSISCGGSNTSNSSHNGTPVLTTMQISPSAPSVAAGLGQQFTATGKYSDGSSKDLTQSASWSSSNLSIATVSSAGMVTSKIAGSVAIAATVSGVTGSATLTVTAPNLVSLVASPTSTSTAPGTATQFTAAGTFTDGSTQNVTASVNWTSSDLTVASINLNGVEGLAKAVAPGTCTVTATSGNISSSAALTVTNASLSSIAVTPVNASVPLGLLQQFTATGTFSDGTTQDITNTVNWSSSNSTVASITVSGLLTARNLGTVTITANSGTINTSVSASVNASDLSSLAISPGNATIAQSTSQQFSAIGTFNDGSTRNLSTQVTWASSSTGVATITNFGLARGVTPGSTTIRATIGSISASTGLNVSNVMLVSISVTPTAQTMPLNTKVAYTATGLFSDSSTQNITRDVTWQSDNTSVATITSSGASTGIAPGTANISATLSGVSGSTPLTVSSATLTSIAVSPATGVLAPASTQQYTATGSFSDGSTLSITNAVSWSSSASNVASVNSSGLVTGQSAGTATIAAQQGSVTGSASLVVDSSQLTSVKVTPVSGKVAEQTGMQFNAVGTFADGSTQNLTYSALWTSAPSSVATVSESAGTKGFATGIAPGSATITSLFAGQVGTASLTVTNATLTSITITPSSASIPLGGSTQFSAVGNFSDGTTQYLTTLLTWTSSDVNVAIINASGLVSSVSTGTTTITANMNGVNATAVLSVN